MGVTGRGAGGGRRLARLLAAVLALPLAAAAGDPPEWTRPIAPFALVGPVDYVGSEGVAAYLIHTSAGAILIDGTLDENAGMVARSIAARGVRPADVRLILVTHAHFDHVGAVAALARATGATVVAGARDRAAIESGTPPGETLYPPVAFPAARVGRAVGDGARVTLGDTTLTAIATPGHTPGCTSWAMRVRDHGRTLAVLFPCSLTVAGNRLVGNRRYPGIVADYRASLARMARERPDVVLPAHPELADVIGRARRGALVDPTLWPAFVAEARADFDADLAKQRATG